MAQRLHAGGREKTGVDVQPLPLHGVGDERFARQLLRAHAAHVRQRVLAADDQHLLIVKHRLEAQAGARQRIGRDEQVNLMVKERADAAELEFLLHVHIHAGPGGQVRRHHFQQPAVAGVAFHADAQRARFAAGQLAQALFGLLQLRQHAASRLLAQLAEAKEQGVKARPVIIGPVTYLALGKTHDGSDRLALLPRLLPVYAQLLERLHEAGAEWVQVDEPLLVTDLDEAWRHAFNTAYHHLKGSRAKLLLATYFGALGDNRYLAAHLPVAGLHVDAVAGREDVQPLLGLLPAHRVLSLGVIHGRNVWKSDLTALLDWLEPLAGRLGERLWLAPSCSLLHVPVDLAQEDRLDAGIRDWLAFALQKLDELQVLGTALR